MLCCGYTLTDFPISIRLTSLALWQSNDCPSASKQPWLIWINTSCEFIMNDCITRTKQSTTKPCAYFLGYTVGIYLISFNVCWLLRFLITIHSVDDVILNGQRYNEIFRGIPNVDEIQFNLILLSTYVIYYELVELTLIILWYALFHFDIY